MPFDATKLAMSSSSLVSSEVPTEWTYRQTDDTLAVIKTAGYFTPVDNQLELNDKLFIVGSDGSDLVEVSDFVPSITVSEFITAGDIADGSVTTPKLANLAVTTAKTDNAAITNDKVASRTLSGDRLQFVTIGENELASGACTTAVIETNAVTFSKMAVTMQPQRLVKFSGTHTTAGGSATESITVTGVITSDIVHVTMEAEGAVAVTLLTSKTNTDAVDLKFSADPSTDHVVTYTVLRGP